MPSNTALTDDGDGLTFDEKTSGDHCHPPFSSLTIVDDSVERRLVEPTVRYDGLMP